MMSGSFMRGKRVVRFFQARPGGRTVNSIAPWGSLGSLRFVGFIQARQGGRSVAPWRSYNRALVVVGFIGVRVMAGLAPLGSSDSFWLVVFMWACLRCLWVHSGQPLWLTGSFGFVGFIRARPGVVRFILFHYGAPYGSSVSSFGRALCFVGFIRVRWVHSVAP